LAGINRYASIPDFPLWIPHDLPEMLIGILKVAGVTAPKCFLSWLYNNRTGILRLLHDRINLGPGRNIMPK